MDAPKCKRGFALMPPETRSMIARMGGRAGHRLGTAHKFDREQAKAAGAKGGATVSADREHMRRIGRMGGRASAQGRASGN